MKHLIYLILIGFTLNLSAQEIARLDSIVYFEVAGEPEYTLSFEYDAEDRLSLVQNLEEDIDFTFTYNADGTVDVFTILDEGEAPLPFNYVYDTNGELDSMLGSLDDSGYEVELLIDIEAEGGLIKRSTFTTTTGGYSFLDSDKKFTYTVDGQLDSIISLDVFVYDGSEVIESVIDHDYVDGKLLSRAYSSLFYPSEDYKDSIAFATDGTTASVLRVGPNPDIFSALQIDYTDAASFADEEFIGPLSFFELAANIFGNEYLDILITLLSNSRPVSHVETRETFSTSGNWYYTILVNTEEEEIPATAISVFPNPTTDYIQVDIEEAISSMELYSMNGELIVTQNTKGTTISLEELQLGNYLLIVRTSTGQNYFSKVQKL